MKEQQHPFKISLEQYGEKITFEIPNSDIELEKAVTMCRDLLVAAGYHRVNVNELFEIEPV